MTNIELKKSINLISLKEFLNSSIVIPDVLLGNTSSFHDFAVVLVGLGYLFGKVS
jgi:hypothetical protein